MKKLAFSCLLVSIVNVQIVTAKKMGNTFMPDTQFNKDLTIYAQKSLYNFMVLNPEPFCDRPGMFRLRFDCYGLPPSLSHNQWDWGDGTGRAVEAWMDIRQMTGEVEFGRKIEEGQRKMLLWLLSPETGMAYVPENSHPEKRTYYYHMWDQGRTLRALVHWWMVTPDSNEKHLIGQKIDKMIMSLRNLATKRVDAHWGLILEFPYDVFNNGKSEESFSPMSGGQLIEPLVKYWEVCGDSIAKAFADALCNGVIASGECDITKSPDYRFGLDGSFTGHFHNKSSIVLGVARHGSSLIKHGQMERGLKLLHWAKMVYDWTISPNNINCGSSWGWFPENNGDGTKSRTIMEICCTADMIELAAVLAGSATLDPSLEEYDRLWDHVERYLLNTIIPSQFKITPEYANLISRMGGDLKTAEKLVGAWAGYHLPNDLVTVIHDDGKHEMLMGSCCNYSGVRGLYACWSNIFCDNDSELTIRLPLTRKSPVVIQTIVEDISTVYQNLQIGEDRKVRVRIPDWADVKTITAKKNMDSQIDYTIDGHYLDFGKVIKGTEINIVYPMAERETKERIGGDDNHNAFTPAEHKSTYTVSWIGNHVVKMYPAGKLLPIFNSN